MDYQYIKIEKKPHRTDIILNNPPVNILTGAVMQELIDAMKAVAEDTFCRIVVLKGQGKAWSAGADVAEHMPDKFAEMLVVFGELCGLIRTYPITTVAAVDGLCLGGGCELAALCDFIIASENAKFGQPEIKVGVIPPAACAHFARKYGLATALELILTGDIFDAETSYKMGIVNKLTTVDGFEKEVDNFVSRFTGNSAVVMRLARTAVFKSIKRSPKEAAKKADEIYHTQLMDTHDAVEGLTAFLEKRKPEWRDE